MIQINLVPDVKQEYIRAKILRNSVISVSILIGIGVVGLAVVLGVVLGGQLVAESIQDNSIKTESAKLMSVKDLDKTVTIQQQLDKIDEQQNSKLITSRLFDTILAINPQAPNDIKVISLKVNPEEKKITLEGSAANGYIALETFKKTLTNTYIQSGSEGEKIALAQDIVAGDTGFGENAEGQRVLRFSFTFSYPDELFLVSDKPLTVITPTGRTDVTDSKLGVPESLFEKGDKDAE